MSKQKQIEQFYDYFDGVATVLYDTVKKPYIEGMNEAFNYLLDDQTEQEYSEEIMNELKQLKEKVVGVSFEKEDVRKSVQLGLLKGYKHTYSSNALITPDTIGIFIGYLMKRLYQNNDLKTLFDPLIGTGNLVYAITNYLEKDLKIFGVDHDLLKCNLARNIGDLMEIDNEVFYQDTLTYYDQGFDCVVMDVPIHEEGEYVPYQVINHHIRSVKDGGFLFAVIENDFFEQVQASIFREEITKVANIFGLIKLSETLFKSNPKSILILRKKGDNVVALSDFLLVDLPSFTDLEEFNKVVNQIDLWISEREEDIL